MDKYTLRKYNKIFNEGSKLYWFNVPLYMKVLFEKGYSAEAISAKVDLLEENEKKVRCARTIGRVREYAEGTYGTIKIGTIKLIGSALANGNEYAFLEEVNPINIAKVMENSVIRDEDDIKIIYRMIYKILSEYDCSCAYNFVPGTEEDAFCYYDKKIDEIKGEVFVRFIHSEDIKKRLLRIINEVESFIKSYSVPGVDARWREINPRIGYFDVVYEFIEIAPELYEEIVSGKFTRENGQVVGFSFIPSKEDFIQRNAYFDRLKDMNSSKNLKYSEERIFRNELLLTFEKVFENDFPELKIENEK